MIHARLQDMLDEMLAHPEELFIQSNSKHAALVSFGEDTTFLVKGDFTGTPEECEAEVRRVLRTDKDGKRRGMKHRENYFAD